MKKNSKTSQQVDGQQLLNFSANNNISEIETSAKLTDDKTKPKGKSLLHPEQSETLTVSQLTKHIQNVFSRDSILGMPVVVEGELSNVKQSSRGHVYFTLKDDKASINGILWASTVSRLKFNLDDGMAVYLTGQLEIYAPSGSYSIVGKKLEPVGVGSLQLAFQQIKEKLEAEGLFLEKYKKPIPEFPKRIAIITSRTGAVIHDMLRVIRQKNPMIDVLIVPVAVQGESAAKEITWAIQRLNWIHTHEPNYAIDTMIIARGGGSFEDLFCFSEEAVVRAVFESDIPIVTGIGHEPDYGLADAAADYSAATPTAAADWTVPDMRQQLREHLSRGEALVDLMNDELMAAEYELDQKATRFTELVQATLEMEQRGLNQSEDRLVDLIRLQLERCDRKIANTADQLSTLSPLNILSRGYAVTSDSNGKIIKSIKDTETSQSITVRIEDGTLDCEVKAVKAI